MPTLPFQPGDSNNEPSATPAKPEVIIQQCHECKGRYPLSYFGLCKREPNGHWTSCKECRAQYFRLRRKVLDRTKSKIDDSVIRNVNTHNKSVLDLALSIPDFKCIGFIPHTNKVFRIHFGKSRYDMPSCAIFNEDGSSYLELAHSGEKLDEVLSHLLNVFRTKSIRLEISDMYMMASKNAIYWY